MIVSKDLPLCPVATAVSVIGNKWKLLILRNLLKDPQRYTDLLKGIDGIINRKTYTEEIPVKVEYSLSEIGETLKPIFNVLTYWENNYKKYIKNSLDK